MNDYQMRAMLYLFSMSYQEMVGVLSLLLILTAGTFHCVRVYQGIIVVNPISWFIWFGISFAILISYISIGATYNMYAAIGNVLFPGVNFFFSLRQKEKVPVEKEDVAACVLGVVSIVLWHFTYQSPRYVQFANYVAIVADLCAIVPTYRLVKGNPMVEKPLPWLLFSLGFLISLGSITVHTVANYVLPIYMCLGAGTIGVMQVVYRVKNSIKEKWYGVEEGLPFSFLNFIFILHAGAGMSRKVLRMDFFKDSFIVGHFSFLYNFDPLR